MNSRLPRIAAVAALAIALPAPLLAQNSPPPAARGGSAQGIPVQQVAQKMRAKLGRLDTNRDNRISQAEFAARKAKRQNNGGGSGKDPAKRFGRIDTNRDGFISITELNAYVQQRASRRDRNHDGVISPDERHKGGKGGKGGKHGGQGRGQGDDDDQY